MRCKEIAEWMSEYIDGHLDDKRTRIFEQHLAGCDSCRMELEHLREAVALLRSVEPVEPPEDLVRNVHTFVRDSVTQDRAPAERGSFWWFFNSASTRAAVAAGIVLVLVFFVSRQAPREGREAVPTDSVQVPLSESEQESKAVAESPLDPLLGPEEEEDQLLLHDAAPAVPSAAMRPEPAVEVLHQKPAPDRFYYRVQGRDVGSAAIKTGERAVKMERVVGEAKGLSVRGSAAAKEGRLLSSAALPAGPAEQAVYDEGGPIPEREAIIRIVKEAANWVRDMDDSRGLQFDMSLGESSARTLLLAEVPAEAYEGLKKRLSDYSGVAMHERSSTNGAVTVVIAIPYKLEAGRQIK